MGLYNILFGTNPRADVILATLGLTRYDVGRFRDCFVADGVIAVYTRNGGGNRENYQDVLDKLSKHPCWIEDRDDDFDCTYCTIYFRFPDDYADSLRSIDAGAPFDPDEKWNALLRGISNGSKTAAV